MKKITRSVITTILSIALLFGATMPTYAASVTPVTCTTTCQANEVEELVKGVEDTFEKVFECVMELRLEACIREFLAKLKQEKNEVNEQEPSDTEIPSDPEVPSEPEVSTDPEIPSTPNESVEDAWVYAEELIDVFEEHLGYRPTYEEKQEFGGYWTLSVYFPHLDLFWSYDVKMSISPDGWRLNALDFAWVMDQMQRSYLNPGIEVMDDSAYYSKETVEKLFMEEYGYDAKVYVQKYFGRNKITADFVVCDRYNGCEIEIDAILTTEGWRISAEDWEWFRENFDLEEESDYANSNIGWWTLEEIQAEFEYMLGYIPDFEICQDSKLDWYQTIEITFEHLGGESYFIQWVFDEDGEAKVTDKVFEEFLDENPEVTYVLELDEDELERMYAFYKARLED